MAIKNAEQHKGINGWYNRSCKHWTELKGKSVGEWITNPVGIIGGRVDEEIRTLTDVNTFTEGTAMEGFSLMGLNKLWRTKLFINRAKSPMEKAGSPLENGGWIPSLFGGKTKSDPASGQTTKTTYSANKAPDFYSHIRRQDGQDTGEKADRSLLILPREGMVRASYGITDPASGQTTLTSQGYKKTQQTILKNQIVIVSPFTSPYQAIRLQNRPNELSYTTTGTWAAVTSMGRNNPFRMYTGGEDSIQLDINWFCNDPDNRGEVITKCRLLESWTKANGYNASPPVLQLVWGSSGLYKNDYWILESASYKLTHFQDRAMRGGEILDFKLYPNYATQTLVFKKVSGHNTAWSEIVSIDELKKTEGVLIQEA